MPITKVPGIWNASPPGGPKLPRAAESAALIKTCGAITSAKAAARQAKSAVGITKWIGEASKRDTVALAQTRGLFWCPAGVLALEAEIRLESASGVRMVKAEDFFVDLMTTTARHGEILTNVAFAPIPAAAQYAYLKHPQPASGFAIVGVAALVQLDKSGHCTRVRVAITGLGSKAFRATLPHDTRRAADWFQRTALHCSGGVKAPG